MNRRLFCWICLAALACSPGAPADDGGRARDTEARSGDGDTARTPGGLSPDEAERRPVIAFLGTSLTAGLGLLRAEDTYVARVGELADSAGIPIRTLNAGVSGDTSAGGLRRLDWVLGEPVDVLVVELGANDGLRGQDPEATRRNLRAIVEQARAMYPDIRVVIAGMEAPPNLGEDYTRRFRAIFPEVARETGADLVPFILEDVAGVPGLNQGDGIHPTPEGHRLMARNVWAVLEPVVVDWYRDRDDSASEVP